MWFQWMSRRAIDGADVVINFGRIDYLAAILRTNVPLLCRFGNLVSQPELDWVVSRRQRAVRLVGVSHHQVCGLRPKELIKVVYNGTDLNRFQFRHTPETELYLAFVGRLTSNKGVDTAIRVARRCGIKLKIGGNISDESGGAKYFEQEVRPQLDSQIEWLGEVDDAAKQNLLAGAIALLFPIRWPEPCANVIAESLACGTPIVATRCASTPEVIEDGKTGFLCDTEDELVAAVNKVRELDRNACRQAAETRFSVAVMAGGYLQIIEDLLNEPQK
jgi:glycosyltransferase involved in cell wall biosynthesis